MGRQVLGRFPCAPHPAVTSGARQGGARREHAPGTTRPTSSALQTASSLATCDLVSQRQIRTFWCRFGMHSYASSRVIGAGTAVLIVGPALCSRERREVINKYAAPGAVLWCRAAGQRERSPPSEPHKLGGANYLNRPHPHSHDGAAERTPRDPSGVGMSLGHIAPVRSAWMSTAVRRPQL